MQCDKGFAEEATFERGPDLSLIPSFFIYKMELKIFTPVGLWSRIKLDNDGIRLNRIPNK